jgi:protein-tyrosine-phosphatase
VRVLFVCTGNTCRSLMAEHIARKRFGQNVEPSSAGTDPGTAADAKSALWTLKRLIGPVPDEHEPLDVRDFDVSSFDLVIALDSATSKKLKRLFPALDESKLVKWAIRDPYGDDLSEYEKCAHSIFAQMNRDTCFVPIAS